PGRYDGTPRDSHPPGSHHGRKMSYRYLLGGNGICQISRTNVFGSVTRFWKNRMTAAAADTFLLLTIPRSDRRTCGSSTCCAITSREKKSMLISSLLRFPPPDSRGPPPGA